MSQARGTCTFSSLGVQNVINSKMGVGEVPRSGQKSQVLGKIIV